MLLQLLIVVYSFVFTSERHFNGGTISWAPIHPYDNSSSVDITITQSYAWAYPTITCATNVPISTSGRSSQNSNLTCVVDCSSDGGYSTKPINILTDCTSVSSSLGMMNSQRSHNMTLTAGAHFYLANVGSAWVALNDPAQSGLEWSIITLIDLRMRSDGFMNTPPVASVVSPQYAFVNKTIQINIPVSDANAGDDVRCRWSTYTAGYRRRKRSDNERYIKYQSVTSLNKDLLEDEEMIHIRKKRSCGCGGWCSQGCSCGCNICDDTTCNSSTCTQNPGCPKVTTLTTITTTTSVSTTTIATTTIETQGTLKSTSSYPHRQAIDECGGICYPGSLPNGTTLSNCTITFTGTKAGTWYAVAVQVEDFMNETSTTPLSSVPVQFLIYVAVQPTCTTAPIIYPLTSCLEVQVGVSISFNLSAINLCNPSVATLSDIVVSNGITGMSTGNLTTSSTNSSISYVKFTWTPQANQIGTQQLCTIAFTSERLQSSQYCVTFTVTNTSDLCVTTTTTTTSTTSQTTTTTSVTTTTTSKTTSTTTSTSTTSTTTSSTSSSTSTTSTTTTTTTSVTTTTTTSATTTTETTTTATTATTTTTKASGSSTNWPLILGLSLLALMLAICCSGCCLYWFLCRSPAAQRNQRRKAEINQGQYTMPPRNIADMIQKKRTVSHIYKRSTSSKNHVDSEVSVQDRMASTSPSDLRIRLSDSPTLMTDVEESRVSSTVSVKKIKRDNSTKMNNTNIEQENYHDNNENNRVIQRSAVSVVRVNKMSNMDELDKTKLDTSRGESLSAASTIASKTAQVNVIKLPRNNTMKNRRSRASSTGNVSVIRLEKSSINIESATDRPEKSALTNNGKVNASNGVTVTKLPRITSVSQDSHS